MPTMIAPSERRSLGLLMAWAALLFACGIWWGLPNDFSWAGDELHPSTWRQAIDPQTPNGWHARYPPLHFALLQGISWPLRTVAAHGWLPLAPESLRDLLMILARLLSLSMALATLWFLYRAAREVLDASAALWSVFILASVVPYVYYAKMANLDVPYVLWFTLSLWLFLRILEHHRLRDYLLFAAAAAAAVCTKDQAYGLYTLAPIPICVSLWRAEYASRRYGVARALLDRRLWLAALTAGVLFALFQDLLFDPHRFTIHLRLLHGPMSENYQDYEGTPLGQWQLLTNILGLLRFALNPALLGVSLVGLGMVFRRLRRKPPAPSARRLAATTIFLLSYYATFLVLILFCYDRYVLPMAVVLALFGGLALAELTRPEGRFRAARLTLAAAIVAYSLLYAASVDFRLFADTRYGVERWVSEHARRTGAAIAVGRHHHIPRLRWVRWERVLPDGGRVLRQDQPEFIVVNLTDIRGPAESALVDRLGSGEIGYRLALRTRGRPLLNWIYPENGNSSQRFINPEMAIFERVAPVSAPAAPSEPVPEPD